MFTLIPLIITIPIISPIVSGVVPIKRIRSGRDTETGITEATGSAFKGFSVNAVSKIIIAIIEEIKTRVNIR